MIHLNLLRTLLLIYSDAIKTKEKKLRKEKAAKVEEKELVDFEECTDYNTMASFQQMHLSRPLLKVHYHLSLQYRTTIKITLMIYSL